VQNEIYGPSVTDNTILKGTNYILCREAMRNLTEAVNRIKIERFLQGRELLNVGDMFKTIEYNSSNDKID